MISYISSVRSIALKIYFITIPPRLKIATYREVVGYRKDAVKRVFAKCLKS